MSYDLANALGDLESKSEKIDYLTAEVSDLNAKAERLEQLNESLRIQVYNFNDKVRQVERIIKDYCHTDELTDELREIAEALDITLTKRVRGSGTLSFSFTAEVPLDFDEDSFEVSFEANCEEYSAEDFDYTEEDLSYDVELDD